MIYKLIILFGNKIGTCDHKPFRSMTMFTLITSLVELRAHTHIHANRTLVHSLPSGIYHRKWTEISLRGRFQLSIRRINHTLQRDKVCRRNGRQREREVARLGGKRSEREIERARDRESQKDRVDQHMDSFWYVSTVSSVFLVSIGCDDACKIKFYSHFLRFFVLLLLCMVCMCCCFMCFLFIEIVCDGIDSIRMFFSTGFCPETTTDHRQIY